MEGAPLVGLVFIDDDEELVNTAWGALTGFDELADFRPMLVTSQEVRLRSPNHLDEETVKHLGLVPAGGTPPSDPDNVGGEEAASSSSCRRFALGTGKPADVLRELTNAGASQLVVATRSALMRADLPAVNTLLDLSTVTSPGTLIELRHAVSSRGNSQTGSQVQARSRVLHIWTITALHSRDATDFRRLEAKHGPFWGLTRDGDVHAIQGLDHVLDYRQRKHVREIISGQRGTQLNEINTSTLNALQPRSATTRQWRQYTPLPEIQPELLVEEPQEARGLTLNQGVNFAVTVLFVILAAVAVRFAMVLANSGVSLPTMLGVTLPLAVLCLNYPVVGDIVRTVKSSASPGSIYTQIARAIEATRSEGAFSVPFSHLLTLRQVSWVKGESRKLEISIRDREPADQAAIFATIAEVFTVPRSSTRWVLETARCNFSATRSLVWFVTVLFHLSKPRYFAVPATYASQEEAAAFADAWQTFVGPCRLRDMSDESPEFAQQCKENPGSTNNVTRVRELR